MAEKTLEKVIVKRVKPVVDEALHKFLGVTIDELNQDISDKIETRPLINFDINSSLSFKAAKKLFKKEFLSRMIRTHYGNISEVAKLTRLNRRSIHRAVNELKINIKKCREEMLKPGYYSKEAVDDILKATFDNYRQIIHPQKLEEVYKHVSDLSDNILRSIPTRELTWKEAEREFEKAYIEKALMDNLNSIMITAKKVKLRYETLIRKMKRFGIRL